jgi:hypothetical protein
MKNHQNSLFGTNFEDLGERRRAKQQIEAETLERLARRAGLDQKTASMLAMNLAPSPKTDWTFVMISPQQNAAVVKWLLTNSTRPLKATELWAHLFEVMRSDTGEILRSRSELAEKIATTPQNISTIFSELNKINAVVRRKDGRTVRYFMNASIATHLSTPEARKKARAADGPLLKLMTGGAS